MSRFPFDQRPTMPVPMPGPPVAPHSHHHPRLPRHFPPNQPQFVHPHSHPAHLMMPPHPPHHIRPELGSRNENLAEERGLFHNPRNLMPDVQQYHQQHQTQMMNNKQTLGHDLMMMHNHQSLGHDLVRPMPGHDFVRPLLDRQFNVPAQAVALQESWRLDQERKSMVERFGGVARHPGAANNHSMPKMHDEMLQRYAAAPDTINSASASGMPFQGMDFGRQDHGDVSAMTWDNPAGISRMDERSDYPQLQSQRKRIRIGADGTVTDIDDEQPLENRYHLQQSERSCADGDTTFQNDSRKRQRPASREEELLIEHGLLDDKEQSMANVGPSGEERRGQFVPHNAETRSTYFNSGSMRSGHLVNHNEDIPVHFESYRHQAHHNTLKDPSQMSSQLPAGMPFHNRAHDQDYFPSGQLKEGSKLPDENFQPLHSHPRTSNPQPEQYHQGTAAWNQAESGRQRGPPEFDSNPMTGTHLPQQQQNFLHGRAKSMSGASQNSLDHSTDVYHNPGLTNHHLPYQEQRQQRSYGSRDGQQMQESIQHHDEQNHFQNLHKSEQQLYAHGQNQFSQSNPQESLPFLPDGHGVQPPRRLHGPLPNSENQLPHLYGYHPPIPPVPLPPLPPSPPRSPVQVPSPPPFPVSTATLPISSSILSPSTSSQALPSNMKSYPHGVAQHSAPNLPSVGSQVSAHPPFQKFGETGPCFPVKQPKVDKPTVVNAVDIFRPPGRATRPDRFVVILRGLPGSGKSYLAKALRDIEVSNGGTAPRIHSMDDYFMTEVEKVEENESRITSGMLSRGKKRVPTEVIEYCYEPEMEEGYRASMLKAFKKTLEEGVFTFIIVDDRNLRVADFAQFWAVAKRSGYEVFLLEAPYKDPVGCATRNVHKFTVETVKEMADKWEIAPPLYLQLDISSLIHGDDLDGQAITEVEMDTNDTDLGEESQNARDDRESDSVNPQPRWVSEDVDTTQVKGLNSCKWSDVKDSDDRKSIESRKPDNNALSGLMQAYGKGDKSVRWADQGHKDFEKGFSIGVKCQNKCSLIIGPGAGYNEGSNPISDEDKIDTEKQGNSGDSTKNKKILEQLRAEQEAFRAVRSVFDRRRQRIGGLDDEDE